MNVTTSVKEIFEKEYQFIDRIVSLAGWVRTRRDSKGGVSFIEFNDGSSLKNLQIVVNHENTDPQLITGINTGCAIGVEGIIKPSLGKEQAIELVASSIKIYGKADPASYPLQKKRHSFEFLRQIAHLRPRTNTIGAVMRLRSHLSYTVHEFFHQRGFFYIHTPIITTSDCEGAGEVFKVTANNLDFFGKPTYLTVSGQLQAEIYALALGKVYTFGPTFRAENSNTRRHLAEFWMIEPEMAFYNLEKNILLAEEFIKALIESILSKCHDELKLFQTFIDKNLYSRLETAINQPFEIITYSEALQIIGKSKGSTFEFIPTWGEDLQTEHEKFLTEQVFKRPVVIIHYPRTLKPFYMRVNDDEKTVAAMDILMPGVGEIIGGSEREERMEVLVEQMQQKGINMDEYSWYLDLRRYGSAPHAGFGLGLERFIQFLTGLQNIRETIPFPRTPGQALF